MAVGSSIRELEGCCQASYLSLDGILREVILFVLYASIVVRRILLEGTVDLWMRERLWGLAILRLHATSEDVKLLF